MKDLKTESTQQIYEILKLRNEGRYKESNASLLILIEQDPASPTLQFILAQNLFDLNDLPAAQVAILKLLEMVPDFEDAALLFSSLKKQEGLSEEALLFLKSWVRSHPENIKVKIAIAEIYDQLKEHDLADSFLNAALQLEDDESHKKLYQAQACMRNEKISAAIILYEEALRLKPEEASLRRYLALAYIQNKEIPEAYACFTDLAALNTDDLNFYAPWIYTCLELGRIQKAKSLSLFYLEKKAEDGQILSLLGRALLREGRAFEAQKHFARAIELESENWEHQNNYLYTLNCVDLSAEQLLQAHQRAGKLVEKKCPQKYLPQVSSQEKLRVAFISPDFCRHSVAYFLLPLFENWNHQKMELILFSNREKEDEITCEIKSYADEFYPVFQMEKEECAEFIFNKQIDIIIDCAGYTRGSNLDSLAMKPAAVQMTYCGYPTGVGMSTIDYRITDSWADPLDFEGHYQEKLLRLDSGFLVYSQPEDYPIMIHSEKLHSKITFGSFNNLTKFNQETIHLWSEILQRFDDSLLILKNHSFRDSEVREAVKAQFKENGIDENRLEFISWTQDLAEHFELYNRLDIALDTFPYHGTTTSCEAMWMGVPVVSLLGNRHASRVAASLFHQVGVEENLCATREEYLQRVLDLARDRKALEGYKRGLRGKMMNSDLMDGKKTTEDFQRVIWEAYEDCIKKQSGAL